MRLRRQRRLFSIVIQQTQTHLQCSVNNLGIAFILLLTTLRSRSTRPFSKFNEFKYVEQMQDTCPVQLSV